MTPDDVRAAAEQLVDFHVAAVRLCSHSYDKISVVSLNVSSPDGLKLGDTVGYAFADRFEQETIVSLEVQNAKVESTRAGERSGYKTGFLRKQLPDGTIVYKVRV
jgi:hypothetical protein